MAKSVQILPPIWPRARALDAALPRLRDLSLRSVCLGAELLQLNQSQQGAKVYQLFG